VLRYSTRVLSVGINQHRYRILVLLAKSWLLSSILSELGVEFSFYITSDLCAEISYYRQIVNIPVVSS
jgi:hypothetical protein